MNGISVLIKETQQSSLTPSALWGWDSCLWSRKQSLTRHQICSTLAMAFPASKTVRTTCLWLISHPVYGTFVIASQTDWDICVITHQNIKRQNLKVKNKIKSARCSKGFSNVFTMLAIIFFKIFIYLFWLHWVFVAASGLSLIANGTGFSWLWGPGLLFVVASLTVEHGLYVLQWLQCAGSVGVMWGLNSCDAWA